MEKHLYGDEEEKGMYGAAQARKAVEAIKERELAMTKDQ